MRENEIVVGLGNNIDYEFDWSGLDFQSIVDSHRIRFAEIQNVSVAVKSERDLVIAILNRIYRQSGGEYFLESPVLATDFARSAAKKITMGGTGIRAAIALAKIGVATTAHLVTMNDSVRKLTPALCSVIWAGESENLYPHLIVQFPEGVSIRLDGAPDGIVRSAVSNRVIMSNDPDNIRLPISPRLKDVLRCARVFLLSGFNVMDDRAALIDRLTRVKDALRELPADGEVFYEEASFIYPEMRETIFSELDGLIDVYSLNEDEIQELTRSKVDLRNPEAVLRSLEWLRATYRLKTIVLHTKNWGLVYGDNPSRYREKLRAGIRMAATRYAKGDRFTKVDFEETARAEKSPEGERFRANIPGIYRENADCLPGYRIELKEGTATTVGLGDAFVGGFLSGYQS